MLDQLRHGLPYVMIVEDDATFASGSKIAMDGKRILHFDVGRVYAANSFNESMRKWIMPNLPTERHKPKLFAGLSGRAGVDDSPYVFDHLALGACDMYWERNYDLGKRRAPARDTGNLRALVSEYGGPVSLTKGSCSRCAISYISSLSGAARFLSQNAFPWCAFGGPKSGARTRWAGLGRPRLFERAFVGSTASTFTWQSSTWRKSPKAGEWTASGSSRPPSGRTRARRATASWTPPPTRTSDRTLVFFL
jgi:hypothetical protein